MFFKKKPKSNQGNLEQSARYNGKPMLRILELYIFDAIGYLSPEDEAKMDRLTPKLAQTLGQTGGWREIVSKNMNFPDNMGESIRGLWDKNSKIAIDANQELSPQKFAEMFADTNLV